MQEKYKDPQVVTSYYLGELTLGTVEKGETVLLGQSYFGDPDSYSSYWNEEKDSIIGKSVKVVLPDEVTFKASYSCDGPYQDCRLNYPKHMPNREYFYAKVYLKNVLLNDEYTEEQQDFAKKGSGAMLDQGRLYWFYRSYVERFKSTQKVLNAYVGSGIMLELSSNNKEYPQGQGIDSDIFINPVRILLKIPGLNSYSYDQQQQIQKFLDDSIVGHNIKVISPDFKQIIPLNKNLTSENRLLIQMNTDIYLEGDDKSLNDHLQEILK